MTEVKKPKAMNITLWIVQVLLSTSLLWAAYTKLLTPLGELAAMWPWTAEHPQLVIITGLLDLLAALGIILPDLLRIRPKLTIYTSLAVIVLMIAAIGFHVSRGEAALTGINYVFAAMAAFIAWGRAYRAPVIPR